MLSCIACTSCVPATDTRPFVPPGRADSCPVSDINHYVIYINSVLQETMYLTNYRDLQNHLWSTYIASDMVGFTCTCWVELGRESIQLEGKTQPWPLKLLLFLALVKWWNSNCIFYRHKSIYPIFKVLIKLRAQKTQLLN